MSDVDAPGPRRDASAGRSAASDVGTPGPRRDAPAGRSSASDVGTPGPRRDASAGRSARPAAAPARVLRFTGTERAFHWVHAAGFTVMAGTGVVMYLPALSARIGDRPTLKAIHLAAAVLWLTALVVVVLVGDRRALREAVRELETFDADDRHWLRGPAKRRGRPKGWRSRVPQGRFNAAEKSHSIVQAALAVLFVVSGVLLWLGERNTAFRLPGTIPLHDAATYVALALVAGHLYLALVNPPTRPALSGIVRGDVDAAWAREHHRKWDAQVVTGDGGGLGGIRGGDGGPDGGARPPADGSPRPVGPGLGTLALAATTTVVGVLVVVLVVL